MLIGSVIFGALALFFFVCGPRSWERYDLYGFIALFFLVMCLSLLGIWVVRDGQSQEDAFMKECQQDHKPYECTAMWRAGESRTLVMPMPVVVR